MLPIRLRSGQAIGVPFKHVGLRSARQSRALRLTYTTLEQRR